MEENNTPNEEEAKKRAAEESAKKNADNGVQSTTISELDRADQIAERLARENDRREEILTREESLAARRAVGGTTEAGQSVEKKKESDSEYRKRIDKEMAEGKTEFGN